MFKDARSLDYFLILLAAAAVAIFTFLVLAAISGNGLGVAKTAFNRYENAMGSAIGTAPEPQSNSDHWPAACSMASIDVAVPL